MIRIYCLTSKYILFYAPQRYNECMLAEEFYCLSNQLIAAIMGCRIVKSDLVPISDHEVVMVFVRTVFKGRGKAFRVLE